MTMASRSTIIRDSSVTPGTGDSLLAPGRIPTSRGLIGGAMTDYSGATQARSLLGGYDYGAYNPSSLEAMNRAVTFLRPRTLEQASDVAGPFVGETPNVAMDPYLRQYQYGTTSPSSDVIARVAAGQLQPNAASVFQQIEQLSPLRTASWAEPMRQQLDPEVQQAISALEGLIPTRLGLTAYYGDVAREAQEVVSPELAATRDFITSRMQEGIPEDMLSQYQQDIRSAQAARGLSYGPASAANEAYLLTKLREEQRQNLLGPAMTQGFQTLSMTGFPEMASVGTVNFAPVGTSASQESQQAWAQQQYYTQLGMAGAESILGLLGLGLGAL